ncbi:MULTISPECIES: AI-2E family transporter [unclassified Pseudomonas]|uniref:AI-2E family transporter n=1 Tax=unclassified Pseudomonas TaxID=196821 RepID=UPI0039B76724
MPSVPVSQNPWSRSMLDVLIRAGLLAVMVFFCYRIFSPFLDLMLWAVILAITLYPVQIKLKNKLGLSDGYTATLLVLITLGILAIPTLLLGNSLVTSIQGVMTDIKADNLQVPLPPDAVANWPLVGKPLQQLWMRAATDLPALVQSYIPQIKHFSLSLLSKVAGFGLAFLIFVGSLIVAGFFMAYGERGHASAIQIVSRICGTTKGPKITQLCTSTIRAVALGVIGIAFIQMLLVGLGFVFMGVPGAGLLALAVLLIGIMQLPATLITIPVIIFVFSTEGASTTTIIFAVYVFVAGLVDNVLKPLLLGRGVNVPMPVILIGALGGMVTGGVIGLFVGPVVLAVGYQLFWQWVAARPPEIAVEDELPPGAQ